MLRSVAEERQAAPVKLADADAEVIGHRCDFSELQRG